MGIEESAKKWFITKLYKATKPEGYEATWTGHEQADFNAKFTDNADRLWGNNGARAAIVKLYAKLHSQEIELEGKIRNEVLAVEALFKPGASKQR